MNQMQFVNQTQLNGFKLNKATIAWVKLFFGGMLTAMLLSSIANAQEQHTEKKDRKDQKQSVRSSEDKELEGFDNSGFDDSGFDNSGFDNGGFDMKSDTGGVKAIIKEPSPFSVSGFLRSNWAAWTRRFDTGNPWAKGRQSLDLSASYQGSALRVLIEGHLEYDMAYLYKTGDYDKEQMRQYQFRLLNGTQSVSYRIGGLDLSTGRQIIAWGEGDAVSALDVISPRDQREPGISDIDDLRLGVWMSRARYTYQQHDFDLVVKHEGYYGEFVPPMADYSPFRALLSSNPLLATALNGADLRFKHDPTGVSAETQNLFTRWLYRGNGLDLGLYGAYLRDNQGVIEFDPKDFAGLFNPTGSKRLDLTLSHRYYSLIGHSGAIPINQFLFKWEVVAYLNKSVNEGNEAQIKNPVPSPNSSISIAQVSSLNAVLSLTYSGFKDTAVGLELQKGQTISGSTKLLVPIEMPIIALRISRNMLRELLRVSFVASTFGWQAERGGLMRADISYSLSDSLKWQLGYAYYIQGDQFGPFYGLNQHDRIFTQLRWDFSL